MEYIYDDSIYYDVEVNELYAIIDITQTYINKSGTSVEIKIRLPQTKNKLLKFMAKINDEKIIQSKLLEIGKAKEKYTDSISSGNTGLIAFQSDDEFFVINIGNLYPNDFLELTTTYYQLLSKYNNKYTLNLDFGYPCYLDNNFNEIYDNLNNFEIRSNIGFNTFSALNNVNIENVKSDKYIKEIDKNTGKHQIIYNEKINNITPIKIMFESENTEKNILFCQYNKILNSTSYFLNYKFPKEIVEFKKNINQEETILFIFVLDQSGSMDGRPLNLVKTSLKIFLHSLPENAYFQLIGFGSGFIKYNDSPIKYSPDNIKNLDNLIDNLSANMDGTYLLSPIEDILGCNNYINFKNSKNLFILTDGMVEEEEKTLDYIKLNKNDFIIHSIGYGKNFDRDFIETIGCLPECTYNFVTDINEINAKIIGILELCCHENIKNIEINSNQKSELEYNQRISYFSPNNLLNYGFITYSKENDINININIIFQIENKKEEIKLNFDTKNIIKLPEGNILSKIIISNLLYNNNNYLGEEACLELSKKYGVLSEYTALYAEIIEYHNKNKNGIIPLTFINKGKNYIFNNRHVNPKISSAKTGKHGHAKTFITYTDPITGKTYKDTEFNLNFRILQKKQNQSNYIKAKNYDLNNIVLTQDLMEGFWDCNDETIKIVKEIKDIYDKASNKIKGLMINSNVKEKDILERKILHTFIIIYFIENNAIEKIDEFKLLIEKGKNFLKKNNIEFDIIYSNLFK